MTACQQIPERSSIVQSGQISAQGILLYVYPNPLWTDAKGQVHDMVDVWFNTTSLEDLVRQATDVHQLDLAQDAAANTVDLTLADVLQTA